MIIVACFQWQKCYSNHFKELTAAGTAPDLHRIPFLPAMKESLPVTKISDKYIYILSI